MRPPRLNLAAIGRKLGVSSTTVHYALHGTGRVSARTKQRVLREVRKRGYRPNLLARGLRTQRSACLGVVSAYVGAGWHGALLAGIDRLADRHGYSVLIANSRSNPAKEQKLVEQMLARKVEGLIVVPVDDMANGAFFAELAEDDLPLVLLDSPMQGLETDCVGLDDEAGGYRAGQHLVGLGRRKIGFMMSVSAEGPHRWARERLAGCNRALREAGLGAAIVLGLNIPCMATAEQFAARAVGSYLRSGGRLDGLFAANDHHAFGSLAALAEHGLRVPQDVSVVGFDDVDFASRIRPGLTTFRPPGEEMGQKAAEMLFTRLHEGKQREPTRQALLEPTLVVRESCGWPLPACGRLGVGLTTPTDRPEKPANLNYDAHFEGETDHAVQDNKNVARRHSAIGLSDNRPDDCLGRQ